MEIIFLVGRVIFGAYFLYNAYNHLARTEALVGYAQFKGVPAPRSAVILSGLLILFGGASVLTGLLVSYGLWAIVLFLVPVTFQMHAFWEEEGEARMNDQVQFGKNLALIGAALMLMAIPQPWPFSL